MDFLAAVAALTCGRAAFEPVSSPGQSPLFHVVPRSIWHANGTIRNRYEALWAGASTWESEPDPTTVSHGGGCVDRSGARVLAASPPAAAMLLDDVRLGSGNEPPEVLFGLKTVERDCLHCDSPRAPIDRRGYGDVRVSVGTAVRTLAAVCRRVAPTAEPELYADPAPPATS